MYRKVRVLECIRQGQIGGGESHLLSLIENLDQSKFEPVVLSFTGGPMVDKLKQMFIPIHIIPTVKPFNVFKWREVKRLLIQEKIDLVHAHGTRANSNILWAARSLNIPVVYTVHGWSFHPDQPPFQKRIRIFGEKYLTSRSDLVISVSSSNQQTGKAYIPSLLSLIVNNGINLKKFNSEKQYKNLRKELDIPDNEILILFLARFTSHKQPLSLIKAFSSAIKSYSKMHLLMVGDGDQKKEAEKMLKEGDLIQKVTLQPFREDVPELLATADIFVLPSLWEGMPIGLIEAMAMGKSIIATRVDGTSEVIRHNYNGFLVETDNLIEGLSKALVDLCNDETRRKQFQQKAIETVLQNFDAESMTRQIENAYINLLTNHK